MTAGLFIAPYAPTYRDLDATDRRRTPRLPAAWQIERAHLEDMREIEAAAQRRILGNFRKG